MCGISGYYGYKEALPLLLNMLKKLEYRGYDSCGLALFNDRHINYIKAIGKVDNLVKKAESFNNNAKIGIAHTRWATHGEVNEVNTHPQFSCDKSIAVVHNGIIENFAPLKKYLEKQGHNFVSETDTEVIAHLFEEMLKKYDQKKAWINTIKLLEGAYAILALYDGKLFIARKSSPLVIGKGDNEFFIASDALAFSDYTKRFIVLHDEEVAFIYDNMLEIKNLDGISINKEIQIIKEQEGSLYKGSFETFMLKEIMEQPKIIKQALKSRIDFDNAIPVFGGFRFEDLKDAKRLIFTACGSSYNACMYSKYLFDRFFDVHVEYASELKYADKKITKDDVLIAVSQSGETIDVLESLKKYKNKAKLSLGIVNVVASSIAREVDGGIYLHAGREIGVAATKTYVTQELVLFLLWLYLSRKFGFVDKEKAKAYINELTNLPSKIEEILKQKDAIKELAKKYLKFNNALLLGRKFNYPTALEGALKIKEVAYVHAEALSAGEMKHGPIALVDDNVYSIFIIPHDSITEKVMNNMQEIKARKGRIIAITTKGKHLDKIKEIADDIIIIPNAREELLPILCIIPLQLFAYYLARLKHYDVDKPRNLAKTVTVE